MDKNDTIIIVATTEVDGYGNLLVTPAGGGDRVKIAAKRSQLHPLFEQGKAVMLHWETYMNRPYVANAKLVEGELPPPTKPTMLEQDQKVISEALKKEPAPQAVGMITKEIGDNIRADTLSEIFGQKIAIELIKWYRSQTLDITRIIYNGKDLPQPEAEPPPDAPKPIIKPSEEEVSPIDLDWLKESLEKIQWADVGKWLTKQYGVKGKRVSEMVKELTKEQAEEFVAEVYERLALSGF